MIGLDARKNLLVISNYITEVHLRDACLVVLNDPEFVTAYGSAGEHHCYIGGLANHTLEVTEYCLRMSDMFQASQCNRDVILTAAIFHDYMKTREYYGRPIVDAQKLTPVETIKVEKTPYRNLIRHVAGSHHEFLKAIDGSWMSSDIIMKIEHCILAHHGRFEWGSPVEPKLVEAHILHFADQFSALYGPTK
jgi:3'-5' exoribonuclease